MSMCRHSVYRIGRTQDSNAAYTDQIKRRLEKLMLKRKALRPEPIVKITSLQNILASAQNRLSASSRRLFAPADSESSCADEHQLYGCSDRIMITVFLTQQYA